MTVSRGDGRPAPAPGRASSPFGAILLLAPLFLATRLAFLLTRPLFFDELFTQWIAAKPLAEMLAALRLDSGPPLFYLVAHVCPFVDARWISLAAAAAGFAAMLLWVEPRLAVRASWLLAAYPAAVFAAADGRGYATCALFAGLGCVALERMRAAAAGDARPPASPAAACALAAVLFVLAAYTHYYGVLFFPLPFAVALLTRERRAIVAGFLASAACGALFIPGFLLLARQPRGAMQWMLDGSPLASFVNFPFAAPYPPSLIAPPPIALIVIAFAVFLLAIVKTYRAPRAMSFAVMTLVPAAIVGVTSLAGVHAYFPLRFESVVAMPLVLWLASALDLQTKTTRRLLVCLMVVIGVSVVVRAVSGYRDDQVDPFRAAAVGASEHIDARTPLVASGYLYLETISARTPGWNPQVEVFPREQALHPGWRAQPPQAVLAAERDALLARHPTLVWIGESSAPELRVLAEKAEGRVLYTNAYVAIIRFTRKTE